MGHLFELTVPAIYAVSTKKSSSSCRWTSKKILRSTKVKNGKLEQIREVQIEAKLYHQQREGVQGTTVPRLLSQRRGAGPGKDHAPELLPAGQGWSLG